MKRIALLIAIGSIIAGIIIFCKQLFAPLFDLSCSYSFYGNVPFATRCPSALEQNVKALLALVPGIVLLILIPINNSRYRTLAMIGICIDYILAIILISFIVVISAANDFDQKSAIVTVSIITSLGFLCAGLSAVTGKDNAPT
ncbi:MAG: hypothetical protein WA821_08305 [Anaerolineales bacterium]